MAATNASEPRAEPQLAHMVFFTLKDKSPEARQKRVAACKKYRSNHPGTVYFSAGTLCEELDRPVNIRASSLIRHSEFDIRHFQRSGRHPAHSSDRDNFPSTSPPAVADLSTERAF